MFKVSYNWKGAQKRMDNQDVFGSKISAKFPNQSGSSSNSPLKSFGTKNQQSMSPNHGVTVSDSNDKASATCDNFYGGPPPDLIRQDSTVRADCKNSYQMSSGFVRWNQPEPNQFNERAGIINLQNNYSSGNNRMQTKSQEFLAKIASLPSHPLCDQGEFLMYRDSNDDNNTSKSSQENSSQHNIFHPIPVHISADVGCRRFNSSPHRFYPPSQYSHELPHRNPRYEVPFIGTMQPAYSAYSRYLTHEDKSRDHFQPRHDGPSNDTRSEQQSVELRVTNLDQSIDVQHLKKLIFSVFNEHVMVLHVSVSILNDGNYIALVKVPSVQDAQFAVSQLHRKKIGFKRILISMDNDQNTVPVRTLRNECVTLLMEIPGQKLPLFKFRELFEKRYHRSISISDMCKIKETIVIDEDGRGRMVSLNPEYKHSPSPAFSSSSDDVESVNEKCFCEVHYKPELAGNQGWAEKDSTVNLPDISIPLKLLSTRIHTLLHSHDGFLPLSSIEWCYRTEFGPFNSSTSAPNDGEDHDYVPLEHLITCIPGVEVIQMPSGFKKINWAENRNVETGQAVSVTPTSSLASQLVLFGREIVDLLKNSPKCQMLFNKFIPAYHHHFGRQCRVADYGYTRLADLISAVSHIVHVIGEGHKKLLTLTHRSQVKRFTADLLRVLKAQPNKQMFLSDLPSAYTKCLDKTFRIVEYGVCSVVDIVSEIPEGIIVVTESNEGFLVSIPRRDQTPEEIDRTKQFAAEVVELIRHAPQCCMEFNKFIPAYHHHFGKQCRVSDYGFTKLIELFEAIPDVVQIVGEGDDKILHLTDSEVLKVLADQLVALVKSYNKQHLPLLLSELPSAYITLYGYSLKPEDYNADNLQKLLNKIRHAVKVVEITDGPIVTIVDRGYVREISLRIRRILMVQLEPKLSIVEFFNRYRDIYNEDVNLNMVKNELRDICVVEGDPGKQIIRLTMLQVFARDVHILLHDNDGRILVSKFERLYTDRFGVPCRPAQYGKANLIALLQSIPDVTFLRGKGARKMLILNKDTAGLPIKLPTPEKIKIKQKSDLMEIKRLSPIDLLGQPVPSCIPSPELWPDLNVTEPLDLIRFESPVNHEELLIEEDHCERSRLRTPPLLPDHELNCGMLFQTMNVQNHREPRVDHIMKSILNGTLPHKMSPELCPGNKMSPELCPGNAVLRLSPNCTPPPSMLPHPTQLLASSESQKTLHYSFDCVSYDSSIESLFQPPIPSSHSTPTRNAPGRQSKSRIAASFTVPIQAREL